AHQDRDGTWDRFEFGRHCPRDDRCPGTAVRAKGYSIRSGLTGLALLAFLGAGYTDREGPYQDAVGQAVHALLRAQMRHGGFGNDERMAGYNDTLATFALAEYHALTHEPRVVAPLKRAVTRLVLSQQELGGWDYLPRADSGRNDTSITAWAVQALYACVAARIHVPRRVLVNAALHFERAAEPDGRVRYSDAGIGFKIDEATLQPVYRHGPAMIAAGLTSEQLLGWRFDSALARRQQALLSQQFPSLSLLQGGDPTQLHGYYYWYYGTIAMFQAGGERWERWNAHLLDALLTLQNRGKPAAGHKPHAYGSWPPFGPNWGKWGRQGSRVYSTALCVLTLEIYYRHTPAYLEEYSVLTAADWRAFLQQASQRQRRRVVEALRSMRLEVAEPVLVGLLRDNDRSVALAAAVALTVFDSPVGRPVLEQFYNTAPAWEGGILAAALERAREIEALPPAQGVVRVFDATQRLATLELPRAYVAMVVEVRRDGRSIAQLRVTKRFTGSELVVAEFVGELVDSPPRLGDTVIAR
ncbi:MAG: prenyltransferase/squalene oxidase repeat-containing protein, partial [Phycisphaerae bacterium]